MSDPSISQSRREARAERIRDYRERNAESTGRFQRQFSTYLAVLLGVVGTLVALGSAVNQLWWGVAGGIVVVLGAVLVKVSDRHRVETIAPEDRPAHRVELGWFLLGVLLVVVGLVLTVHPW